MKKSYDSTIEEAVFTVFRLAEITGTVTKLKWFGIGCTPVIFLALFLFFPGSKAENLFIATVMSVMFLVGYLLMYRSDERKRIHKALVKARGTDQPVPSEYEIGEKGLTFRQQGLELTFSWPTVVDVHDIPDFIEIHVRLTGIARIPKRIFATPDELQQWMSTIEKYRKSNNTVESDS